VQYQVYIPAKGGLFRVT